MNIFVDCSRVMVFGGNHGVPRVVRNIINNIPDNKEYGIIPVAVTYGQLRVIDRVPEKQESILKYLKLIKKSFFRTKKEEVNNRLIKDHRSIKTFAYNLFSTPLLLNKKVTPKKGDIFVTTDNFFASLFPKILSELKRKGVTIGSMQHDLIPVRFGQFYPPEDITSFKAHLENSLKFSDICITVSDYVKSDLKKYIAENANNTDINSNIKIDSYRHGYNICDAKTESSTYNEELKNIFSKPTYIIVSTIEPRKNHAFLLDAFEKVWNSGIEVNLLIIGKIGWMVDNLIERIKNHKQFNKQLFLMNNVSDSELLYCYKNAKALITPSVTEGFGLPIIEALSQKTPVLASDIPVFREVGGDFCLYFNLSSPDNLAKIIIDWEKSGQKPTCRNINEFTWPTWKESASEFIDKVIALSKQVKRSGDDR